MSQEQAGPDDVSLAELNLARREHWVAQVERY
jgi:hypothetical protein